MANPWSTRVRIETEDAGPRLLRFRVAAQEGERVTENNVRDVLVDVVNKAEKILYFEGEPRWEVKFLRRAVSDDENLQVVVLQRTAESKFLRLDVDDAEELAAGFPKTQGRAVPLPSAHPRECGGELLHARSTRHDRRTSCPSVGGGLLVPWRPERVCGGKLPGHTLGGGSCLSFMDDELSTGAGPYFGELSITPTRERVSLTPPRNSERTTARRSVERWEVPPARHDPESHHTSQAGCDRTPDRGSGGGTVIVRSSSPTIVMAAVR